MEMLCEEIADRIRSYIQKNRIDAMVDDTLGNYVYGLYAPGEKLPFYIGKGIGSRALNHFDEVIKELSRVDHDGMKSLKWRTILKAFENENSQPEIRIIRRNLQEQEVWAVEGALIDVLEPVGNKVRGSHSIDHGIINLHELIVNKGAKPVAPSAEYQRVYLYSIEKGYRRWGCHERSLRGDWKRGKREIKGFQDFQRAGGKAFGVGLIKGISRSIIEIKSWTPSPDDPERYQMVGSLVNEEELLHKKWTHITGSFNHWKYGKGLVVQLRKEGGINGFSVLSGGGARNGQFQSFAPENNC